MNPISQWRGRVHYVYDGDTLQVGGERVRLLGINSPELENPRYGRKGQCMGEESKTYLEALVLGREVELETDPVGPKRDRFGRILAWVRWKGVEINREMVARGLAFVFRKTRLKQEQDLLLAEWLAARNQQGAWAHCEVDCSRGYCQTQDASD